MLHVTLFTRFSSDELSVSRSTVYTHCHSLESYDILILERINGLFSLGEQVIM